MSGALGRLSMLVLDTLDAVVNGVHCLGPVPAAAAFRKEYLEVRRREGRLFPDDIVAKLPELPDGHRWKNEWTLRARSLDRLERYLRARDGERSLLDLGCGNGWMANRLARIPDTTVLAVDLNLHELEQGARVFEGNPRLHFAYTDIFAAGFEPGCFDTAVLAGSAQYFPDLSALFNRLLQLVRPDGEIHVLDTPFYAPATVAAARERSRDHYVALGRPDMARHYHHHLETALEPVGARKLYEPRALQQRIKRRFSPDSPFPWFVIS